MPGGRGTQCRSLPATPECRKLRCKQRSKQKLSIHFSDSVAIPSGACTPPGAPLKRFAHSSWHRHQDGPSEPRATICVPRRQQSFLTPQPEERRGARTPSPSPPSPRQQASRSASPDRALQSSPGTTARLTQRGVTTWATQAEQILVALLLKVLKQQQKKSL